LGLELIPVYSLQVILSHPPDCRLPLLSARHAVTFPSAQHHPPWLEFDYSNDEHKKLIIAVPKVIIIMIIINKFV